MRFGPTDQIKNVFKRLSEMLYDKSGCTRSIGITKSILKQKCKSNNWSEPQASSINVVQQLIAALIFQYYHASVMLLTLKWTIHVAIPKRSTVGDKQGMQKMFI